MGTVQEPAEFSVSVQKLLHSPNPERFFKGFTRQSGGKFFAEKFLCRRERKRSVFDVMMSWIRNLYVFQDAWDFDCRWNRLYKFFSIKLQRIANSANQHFCPRRKNPELFMENCGFRFAEQFRMFKSNTRKDRQFTASCPRRIQAATEPCLYDSCTDTLFRKIKEANKSHRFKKRHMRVG